MSKDRDRQWAEEMLSEMPPKGYSMTLTEGCALMNMSDPLYSVVAAYNYGFKRGKKFERNTSPAPKPSK